MPTLHTTIARSVKTLPQPAPRGEFVMSGNLTTFDNDPEQTKNSDPATGTMPNYLTRKEVQLMLRKLRNSVSLWERIRSIKSNQARDDAQHLALPQHNRLFAFRGEYQPAEMNFMPPSGQHFSIGYVIGNWSDCGTLEQSV
ncbi:hypothetical protein JOE65_000365 [Arthrobacter roseus]|nr:hypothetical protein [Arthrobacter roseus]